MMKLFFWVAGFVLFLSLAKQVGTYIHHNGFRIPAFDVTLEAWGILVAGLGGAALAIDTISSQRLSEIIRNEVRKIENPPLVLWHTYTTIWTLILSIFFVIATVAVAFGALHQGYEVFSKRQYDFLNLLDLFMKLVALFAVPTLKVAVLTTIWHLPGIFDDFLLQYKEQAEGLRTKIKGVGWKLFVIGSAMQFLANVNVG